MVGGAELQYYWLASEMHADSDVTLKTSTVKGSLLDAEALSMWRISYRPMEDISSFDMTVAFF